MSHLIRASIQVLGVPYRLYQWFSPIAGLDENGKYQAIKVSPGGNLISAERVSAAVIGSVTTNADNATYTDLASAACDQVELVNDTGVVLLVKRGGAGSAFELLDGKSKVFAGLEDADELSVLHKTGGSAVTASYEAQTLS